MASLADMPELKTMFDSLMARREVVDAELAPLREEYDALQEKMTPLIERQRELSLQIKALIAERNLGQIQNQLAAIARAAGGYSTSQAL